MAVSLQSFLLFLEVDDAPSDHVPVRAEPGDWRKCRRGVGLTEPNDSEPFAGELVSVPRPICCCEEGLKGCWGYVVPEIAPSQPPRASDFPIGAASGVSG